MPIIRVWRRTFIVVVHLSSFTNLVYVWLKFCFTQLQVDSPSHFTSNLSPEAMENLKEELNNTKVHVTFLAKDTALLGK